MPPNASTATGSGSFILNDAQTILTVSNLVFSGLTAGVTGAHIHCCVPAGTNAPVRIDFIAAGFPTGVTSGSYGHTFTLATDVSGITVSAFLTGLLSGQAYVNIHDPGTNPAGGTFAGGEIRAQLVGGVSDVPEPGSVVLMALSLAGLAALRFRSH